MSECHKALISMRGQVTWHLIQIKVACIWRFGCDWRAKG